MADNLPAPYVGMQRAQYELLVERSRDLDEALSAVLIDMGKIARGEIRDPRRFARESVQAANMILVPR